MIGVTRRIGIIFSIFIIILFIGTSSSIFHEVDTKFENELAQSNKIRWYHDCSNTSGFQRVDQWNTNFNVTYGEMISSGTYLRFDNLYDQNGAHGPVFVHEFNESFQLAALEAFSIQLYMNNWDGRLMGQIRVSLVDSLYRTALSFYSYDVDDEGVFS